MKVFKTSNWGNKIEECEVVSETPAFYSFKTSTGHIYREKKVSSYNVFHATRNEAENYLLNRIDARVKYLLEEIEHLKKQRENLISGKS